MPATPTDVYLIRKAANPRSVKYSKITDVFLSGLRTAYAAVTGNAGTGVVTITGATLANGMQIIFTSLTGGSGLSTGVAYFAISSSGATCQLSLSEGGSAVALGTNITAGTAIVVGNQMRVWTSEYRDIFSSTITGPATATVGTIAGDGFTASMPGVMTDVAFTTGGGVSTVTPTIGTNSDEVAHSPLRQTLVNRTFWVFDRGSGETPRYLYAEYQTGDVIADNAPSQ